MQFYLFPLHELLFILIACNKENRINHLVLAKKISVKHFIWNDKNFDYYSTSCIGCLAWQSRLNFFVYHVVCVSYSSIFKFFIQQNCVNFQWSVISIDHVVVADDETPFRRPRGSRFAHKRLCNIRCAMLSNIVIVKHRYDMRSRIRATSWRQSRHLMSLSNSTSHKILSNWWEFNEYKSCLL